MILWLGLGSSLTLVLVLALVTRHYRARFVKLKYQKKRENLKGSSEDQFTADDPRDELDPRYSNSSASREFEQSFTYKDQLEHFLTTASSSTRPTRKSRKSRSNSLENILENRKQQKSEADVFYHQFIPQETEIEDQDGVL